MSIPSWDISFQSIQGPGQVFTGQAPTLEKEVSNLGQDRIFSAFLTNVLGGSSQFDIVLQDGQLKLEVDGQMHSYTEYLANRTQPAQPSEQIRRLNRIAQNTLSPGKIDTLKALEEYGLNPASFQDELKTALEYAKPLLAKIHPNPIDLEEACLNFAKKYLLQFQNIQNESFKKALKTEPANEREIYRFIVVTQLATGLNNYLLGSGNLSDAKVSLTRCCSLTDISIDRYIELLKQLPTARQIDRQKFEALKPTQQERGASPQ